ncbi:MAG: hypothetical protein ABIG94_05790 [Pseudomonadota bacterium]
MRTAEAGSSGRYEQLGWGQLNLLKGHGYKVVLEESFKHEKPEVRARERRWFEQIPTYCGGFIGLYRESSTVELQWYTPSKRKTARKILDSFPDKGLRLDDHFDGHEAVLYFPPEILREVCEMAGARKKRQGRPLTPEEKAKLVEAGKAHRFKRCSCGASERQEIRGGSEGGR